MLGASHLSDGVPNSHIQRKTICWEKKLAYQNDITVALAMALNFEVDKN